MPRTSLTQRVIARLPAPDPGGKQLLHWDVQLRGFGVLCSGTTNQKVFVAQRDLPRPAGRRLPDPG